MTFSSNSALSRCHKWQNFTQANNIPLELHTHLLFTSSGNTYLSYFHFLAIMNSVALKTWMSVLYWFHFRYITRNELLNCLIDKVLCFLEFPLVLVMSAEIHTSWAVVRVPGLSSLLALAFSLTGLLTWQSASGPYLSPSELTLVKNYFQLLTDHLYIWFQEISI